MKSLPNAISDHFSIIFLLFPFLKNMAKFILRSIYGFFLFISFIRKDYQKTLILYRQFLKNNLNPNKKILNHDLIILKNTENLLKEKNIVISPYTANFEKIKILILNSAIYDVGGHTEVSIRFIEAFTNEYTIDFYLTTFDDLSENTAHFKSKIIKNLVNKYNELAKDIPITDKITELYSYIIDNKITTVCVNMNPTDVVCCAVLGLLKKYTNINIIFWNNVSHCYSLGTEFANTILTRCKYEKAITPYLSGKTNVKHIPFFGNSKNINIYSPEAVYNLKQKLNIPKDAFITITGVQLYKVNRKYFEFLNKLLQKHDNIYHVFISTVNSKTKESIKNFLGENKNRFIMIDSVLDFDLFIQMSNLYIDSFPQGSALTLIDFIKHAKPVIIKINEDNHMKSFETYLYDNYEYACKTTDEMFDKISELITNKHEYDIIAQKVKVFYDTNYNTENIKNQHKKLIK